MDELEMNIESKPLISVILPVNKNDGYFNQAVLSILEQSYSNLELIIIANNCNDDLWSVILALEKKDSRIRPYRLNMGGLVFSLNFGIEMSNGTYIARMDADDICLKTRLEEQMDYFLSYPKVDVLGTQIKYIDENSNIIDFKPSLLPTEASDLLNTSYHKCPLYHPTVMFKKDKISSLGGYKYAFYGEDYELWNRCFQNDIIINNLDRALLLYRVHSNQSSQNNTKKNKYVSLVLILSIIATGKYKYLLGFFVQFNFVQYFIRKTSSIRQNIRNKQ